MSLTLMYLGMWKLVFFSLPAVVFTLKATDVVGRKFGYNILRSSQEMSFYPIRLMKYKRHKYILKTIENFQLTDTKKVKLLTTQRVLLQFSLASLGYCFRISLTVL